MSAIQATPPSISDAASERTKIVLWDRSSSNIRDVYTADTIESRATRDKMLFDYRTLWSLRPRVKCNFGARERIKMKTS